MLSGILTTQEFPAEQAVQGKPEISWSTAAGDPTPKPSPAFHFKIRSVAALLFSTKATFEPSRERATDVTALPVPVKYDQYTDGPFWAHKPPALPCVE